MPVKRIVLLFIVVFFYSIATSGQDGPPPPAAEPTKANRALIDKIIEVTQHEGYFIEYCSEKVTTYAVEHEWSKEKTREILGSIKFAHYSSTIYNSYAFYTTDQLSKLLDALILLNSGNQINPTMVLTNSMMQFNLDAFVESLIEGKYVTTKKK